MNSVAPTPFARRVLTSLLVVASLVLAVGCGSSSGIPSLGGGFSKMSLKGQYAISQTGIGVVQPTVGNGVASFSETIIFTADGNGGITATCDDFDQVGGPFGGCTGNVAGSYSLASDGTGSVNIGGANGANYAITMIDDSHFYIIEQDLFATASGFGEKQDTTAFAAAPSGTFVFKAHDVQATSRVGGVSIAAGAISGTEDLLSLGLLSTSMPVATSVAMSPPDTNGRGTFALTDGTSFHYYIVNAGKFYIMSNSASGSLEIGQAEAQTGGPFSLATLAANNSYVFGSSGDTSVSGPAGIHSAGVFTTDGNGNVIAGAVDYVQDTTVNTNLTVSGGTYSLASNGRGVTNLMLAGGTISPQVFWMVNGSRAYFLANETAAVEDGTFTLQTGSPFSTLSNQSAFFMDGFDTAYKDRVGLFKATGTGAFNWNQAATSFDPSVFPPAVTLSTSPTNGTYQVSANGRVAVVVNNVTTTTVFYLSSANTGFMVQEDADIGGSFSQQASQ